jgi:hypothetical protein
VLLSGNNIISGARSLEIVINYCMYLVMYFIVVFTLLSGLPFDNPNSKEKRANKILRESESVTQMYMIIKPEKAFVS